MTGLYIRRFSVSDAFHPCSTNQRRENTAKEYFKRNSVYILMEEGFS